MAQNLSAIITGKRERRRHREAERERRKEKGKQGRRKGEREGDNISQERGQAVVLRFVFWGKVRGSHSLLDALGVTGLQVII